MIKKRLDELLDIEDRNTLEIYRYQNGLKPFEYPKLNDIEFTHPRLFKGLNDAFDESVR